MQQDFCYTQQNKITLLMIALVEGIQGLNTLTGSLHSPHLDCELDSLLIVDTSVLTVQILLPGHS